MGAILNGMAGIVIGAAPSLVSSRWFPPNERTTATGKTKGFVLDLRNYYFRPLDLDALWPAHGPKSSSSLTLVRISWVCGSQEHLLLSLLAFSYA